MIAYFPAPYPDELFYSVLSRFYVHSGHIAFSHASNEMFEVVPTKPNVDFISKLKEDIFEKITDITPIDELVMMHTMFPYFARFYLQKEKETAFRAVAESCGNYYSYFPKSHILPDPGRKLRYCPLCADEDRKKYGETYWHRVHQIPEIRVCVKHRCRLVSAKYKINNRSVSSFHSAEKTANQFSAETVGGLELKMAEYLTAILEADFNFQSAACHVMFQDKMIEKEYFSLKNKTRDIGKMKADINRFYSPVMDRCLFMTKLYLIC